MMTIRPLLKSDLKNVKVFTDQWIGKDYYTVSELESLYQYSHRDDFNVSFLALDNEEIVGIRLSFLPGIWLQEFKTGLSKDKWECEEKELAYFKSLFIHENYRGQGLGPKLSQASLDRLKKVGAKSVLCHSWLESPEGSSRRYLEKIGFKLINKWPKFWYPIDYLCTRCAPERCICTAGEMILSLKGKI
jgi:hypothetical protein